MSELARRALRTDGLFSLQFVHDARLSPDGRHAVCVTSRTIAASADELFELTVLNLESGERRKIAFDGCATHPRWSPDGTCLAFIGVIGGQSRLYLCDADGKQLRALSAEAQSAQGPPDWHPHGSSIAYVVATQHRSEAPFRRITKRVYSAEELGIVDDLRLAVHLVDVETGQSHALDLGCAVATQPQHSPCGKRLLFLASDAAVADQALVGGLKLCVADLFDGRKAELLDQRWFVAAAAWSPCGEHVVFAGACNSPLIVPKADLWTVGRDGSNPQCRTTGLEGTIGFRIHHDMPTWGTSQDSMLSVPDVSHAYATVLQGGRAEIWRIALQGATKYETVVGGARSCLIMDTNTRAARALYCVSDLNTPWDLYISNLDGEDEARLTELNASVLAEWPPLCAEELRFESADGVALEGWCLTRADREGPQPTVLFIHGGPMLAVGHAFRFDFHLLAANGYSVLFSNFRGSSGYGEAFTQALVGDWGARGYPDHIAAVDAAIERGLADPERLGVWGPSHGGFATCWIVTHTNRFRAAVAEASCTNFSTMYYLSDAPDLCAKDLGGKPHEIPDVYRSRSPLTYAHFCRTPTLMLHGEEDLRCPVAEAGQFYRALHDAGCTTELVIIPGMTHMGDSVGPLPARLAQNEALLDWFERYL